MITYLQRMPPHPLDARLTRHNGVECNEKEKAAIDILALIIRAINSHCDPLEPSLPASGPTV